MQIFGSFEQMAFLLSVYVVPEMTVLIGATSRRNSTEQGASWKVSLELTPAQP